MASLTIPTSELGFDYDVHLMPWQKKLHGFRIQGDKKWPLEGGLGLCFRFLTHYDQQGWLDSIPTHLLQASNDYPEYQYQMLWLAANCSAAHDLLLSRPIVLALICDRHRVDNEQAITLCRLGQKQALTQLGLDGTKAALKFLDKLTLDFQMGDELEHVKRMLRRQEKRYLYLSHYRRIDYLALRLDQIFPFLSGSRLGLHLLEQGNFIHSVRLSEFQDTLDLGLSLGIDNPLKTIANQANLASFRDLHDRWALRYQRLPSNNIENAAEEWDKPYPSSLLSASASITPINNYRQLREEGEQMNHCIAIYHPKIQRGRYVAFRMTHPERLTIGICQGDISHFSYRIDQIKGYKNAAPSEQSLNMVYQWFEEQKNKA